MPSSSKTNSPMVKLSHVSSSVVQYYESFNRQKEYVGLLYGIGAPGTSTLKAGCKCAARIACLKIHQLLSFALNVEIACLSVHIAVQSTCQWQNFVLNVDRHYLHSQPQRARAHFFNPSNLGKFTILQTWMAAAKSGSPHLTKGV